MMILSFQGRGTQHGTSLTLALDSSPCRSCATHTTSVCVHDRTRAFDSPTLIKVVLLKRSPTPCPGVQSFIFGLAQSLF